MSSSSAAASATKENALKLTEQAQYTVPGDFLSETQDNEDHTFCGVMFTIQTKDIIPIKYIELQSISVRGGLGKMTVWWTKLGKIGSNPKDQPKLVEIPKEEWTQVYEKSHEPSHTEMVEFNFTSPIHVPAGESVGMYVHSMEPGDRSVVYDNKRSEITSHDDYIAVWPGFAHIGNNPFSDAGYWGYAWRNNRAFVGRVRYGAKYKLWRPQCHTEFPPKFKLMLRTVLLCSVKRSCYMSRIPCDVVLYMLNMCSWDWGGELGDQEKEEMNQEYSALSQVEQPQPWARRFLQEYGQQHDDTDDEEYEEGDEDDDDDSDDDEGGAGATGRVSRSQRRAVFDHLMRLHPMLGAMAARGELHFDDDDEEEEDDDDDDDDDDMQDDVDGAGAKADTFEVVDEDEEEDDDEEEEEAGAHKRVCKAADGADAVESSGVPPSNASGSSTA